MALQKSKELASGVSGEYHKCIITHLDTEQVKIKVLLFKDQTAKNAGKPMIEESTYSWSGVDNPCTIAAMDEANSNPIKLCYEKLKTLDEFSGASDV